MSISRTELRPGYNISRVIKGGWQLAGGHGTFDRQKAVDDMLTFVDRGITTFDCADIYTGVEAMIGDAVKELRQRESGPVEELIQVHTKLVPDLDKLTSIRHEDIEAIIDRSLKRLNLDQLHLVQFFWWDLSLGDPLASLDVLKKLKAKGKIRHLGCTNWNESAMQPFVDDDFDMVSAQVQYSLLDKRPAGDFSHWCENANIQILCYGVLAGGFLTARWLGQPDPGFSFENRSLIKYRLIIEDFGGWDLFQSLLQVLDSIGKEHNVPLSAVATSYMMAQPQVAATIIGARTADNIDETLASFEVSLTAANLAAIEAVTAQAKGPRGSVYELESDRNGPHGRIMKYNLNTPK
ncbi:aldo/keto reductase [Granulosicoccus antarcticus]|uniref:General stress protein 69 n=1 Tax=Granulosicoccus antarcticus IMCC3135 TaxID=1192854 RepID=A0A2Z2NPK3_9GAMM|nr:aldo/keto reductase [Granulosicoccus antarcticus]ASJ70710.1 General stress protein 69 [Granulosicoccus antarcticus IMCC3135]